MREDDFERAYPEPVVYMRTTIPFYGYFSHHVIWGAVFRRLVGHHGIPQVLQYLVKPAPAVQDIIGPLLNQVGNGELITVHLRCVDSTLRIQCTKGGENSPEDNFVGKVSPSRTVANLSQRNSRH